MPGPTEKRFSRTNMVIPRSGSRRFSKEAMKLAEDSDAIQLALNGSETDLDNSKNLRESMVKNALRRGSTVEAED
jgi:hypothetical protein